MFFVLFSSFDVAEEKEFAVYDFNAVDDLMLCVFFNWVCAFFVTVDFFKKNFLVGRFGKESKSVVDKAEAFDVAELREGFVAAFVMLNY